MKKIISIVVLSLFLSVQTSSAFVPLTIPAWYYGAGALAVGGGAGVYCAMKSGYASTVDVAGDLRRKSGVAWVTLSAANLPVLHESNVTAKKTYAQIVAAVSAQPTLYAKLKAAITTLVYPGYTNVVALPSSGLTYSIGSSVHLGSGRCVQVILTEGSTAAWNGNVSGSLSGIKDFPSSGFFEVYHPDGSHPGYPNAVWIEKDYYTVKTAPTPSELTAAPADFKAAVAPTGTVTDSGYQAELDKALQDTTYIPTFTDDTTGLPFAYPPAVMTPAQVAAYNAQGVAAEERENALTAAQTAAASAIAARDAAVANANANPTDTALAQKAADATAAAAAATAAAQRLASENATTTAAETAKEAEKEADESFTSVTVPAMKVFSWARFADLRGLLATTFPFNELGRFATILGSFVREPVAPTFTLPMYGGNTLSVSLSMFDGIALFFRWAFSAIMSIGIIHRIIVFYRGA